MDLLAFLFPPRCVGCGGMGSYLCFNCVNFFVPMDTYYCPVCRRASFEGRTHMNCSHPHTLDGLMNGYPYSGTMIRAIKKFKYSFVADLTETLVELMISGINHPLLYTQSWTLVPVPLHSSRFKWRGFNQAEVLASGLARSWHLPLMLDLVTRCRATAIQSTLSSEDRKTNLKKAFQINNGSSIPENILLVDDVATTGSTLIECARVLKQAGARVVWGVTLAQTIPYSATGL